MKKTIRFLITGVGGQGTILASDILAEVGAPGSATTPRNPTSSASPCAAAPWSATSSGAKTSARP